MSFSIYLNRRVLVRCFRHLLSESRFLFANCHDLMQNHLSLLPTCMHKKFVLLVGFEKSFFTFSVVRMAAKYAVNYVVGYVEATRCVCSVFFFFFFFFFFLKFSQNCGKA